jgi:hypothetical protein
MLTSAKRLQRATCFGATGDGYFKSRVTDCEAGWRVMQPTLVVTLGLATVERKRNAIGLRRKFDAHVGRRFVPRQRCPQRRLVTRAR